VSEGDLAGYGGAEARKAAFAAQGEDGAWLRKLDAVALIDGTVFCHGGVDAHWAEAGIASLNEQIRHWIDATPVAPGDGAVIGDTGPLWNRAYLLEEEAVVCPELEKALASLHAKRMVVGHTTQDSGRPLARCNGKLWGIDTGISAHYGNRYAALELRGDTATPILPQ
jgi:hypothetical protein